MHWDALVLAKLGEIRLAFGTLACLPGLNGSLVKRKRMIWDGEMIINGDGSSETSTGRTRSDRIVETEERGR